MFATGLEYNASARRCGVPQPRLSRHSGTTPMRYLALVIALAAAAGGAYLYVTASGPASAPSGAPGGGGGFAVPVEAQPVKVATLVRSIPAVGTLRSAESLMVRPEIAGRIADIRFNEGQSVTEGQVLVTLDDSIARAELAEARANLILSRSAYERAARLLKEKVGTVKARDEALAKLRADEARVAVAEARLAKTVIRAPFKGIVGLRRVSPGDYVNVGQDIVNLEQIDRLKVDFRVPELELSRIATGQAVTVTVDALPGRTFSGEVYAIDPAIDPKGRSIAIRARIDNPALALRPGGFARISLETGRFPDAILVPEEAIVPRGNERFVFRVIDGKASLARIALGERRPGEVHVVSGLAAGDVVVTAGQIKLQDGTPVKVVPGPGRASIDGTKGASPEAEERARP